MKRLFFYAAHVAIVFLFLSISSAGAAGIFNTYDFAEPQRTPSQTYEEDRTVTGDEGLQETLAFRISLYGQASANMPLLVQVHEWGGDFEREEQLAGYVPDEYNFIMLYFQYKPSSGNEDDWWFGTQWEGQCRMWAHEAVMGIAREAINTSLVPNNISGASIDKNRVYMFGHSIGGTGTWQLAVRNPDVFAAAHAHAGFARFTGDVPVFETQFNNDIVGAPADGVTITGDDGKSYSAREYSDLSWWLTEYNDASYETPFINITAGINDDIVQASSGGDLMRPVFDTQKRGYFYMRHDSEDAHSAACFVRMNWMWNFRLNQSFLAFTNRSGYGIGVNETVHAWDEGGINDPREFGWDPASIVDTTDLYQVQLTGSGTADITLRRVQNFPITAGATYIYWLDTESGPGTTITADQNGLLTVPAVTGPRKIIIRSSGAPPATPDYSGWWYDSSAPGTGLSMELQNNILFLAWYVYDTTGQPVWYVAWAPNTSGTSYSGTLRRYTGWALGSPWQAPEYTSAGTVGVTFSNADAGSLSWNIPGTGTGSMNITKYMPSIDSGTADPDELTGWWYDPNFSGMGFFLETRGSTLYLAWYHFRADGSPRWQTLGGWTDVGGFPAGSSSYSGTLQQYAGGQTIGGSWQQATLQTGGDPVALTFTGSTPYNNATLTWGPSTFNLQRYTWSSVPD